jgi:SAM-dependent methyltransferase
MKPLSLMGLAQLVDTRSYRKDLFGPGRTAGHAVVVLKDVLERAKLSDAEPVDAIEFIQMVKQLKLYAPQSSDLVVAPGLEESPTNGSLAVLKAAFGSMATLGVVVQPLLWAALVYLTINSWMWGGALLAIYLVQLPVVTSGCAVRSRGLWWTTLLRPLVEIVAWIRTVANRSKSAPTEDPVEVRRPIYKALLANGIEHFFEAQRDTCPMCLGSELEQLIELEDQYQRKPGRFNLDQCTDCNHIFQNPRLSLEGLRFYYRDFYDGLGEETMAGIFGFSDEPYLARAQMVEGFGNPESWLDVGGGHGHFCLAARGQWPNTRFDCLDFSQSVIEAEQRGWVKRGIKGLFPDSAEDLANQYDVVSMSHYLEHVREPVEELKAAHKVLKPDGLLMIEVPDPDSRLGRILGRYWLPWFQPQHLHFVSAQNLAQLFNKYGFEALLWHRGKAHQKVDFFLASIILLEKLGPDPRRPWNPPMGFWGRLRHKLVWGFGLLVIAVAILTDRVLAPFLGRLGWSNTYRVLAKRVALPSEQRPQH